jgi:hypothetical protein
MQGPGGSPTIRPSPFGVVRIGSRKKAATHKLIPAKAQPSTSHSTTTQKKRVIAAAMTTNLRPSGCTLGIR